MRIVKNILPLLIGLSIALFCKSQQSIEISDIEFWGNKISFQHAKLPTELREKELNSSFDQLMIHITESIGEANEVINKIKKEQQLSDWLTYQLIRKCANAISPKEKSFNLYTLTKAALLDKIGYAPLLCWEGNAYLLYIKSNEEVFNLPIKLYKGQRYVCINHHDFNFAETIPFSKLSIQAMNHENGQPFKFSISSHAA